MWICWSKEALLPKRKSLWRAKKQLKSVYQLWLVSRNHGALEVRIKKAASKQKAKEELIKYIIQKQDGSTLYISR